MVRTEAADACWTTCLVGKPHCVQVLVHIAPEERFCAGSLPPKGCVVGHPAEVIRPLRPHCDGGLVCEQVLDVLGVALHKH